MKAESRSPRARSLLLLAGFSLVALGLGNMAVSGNKLDQYTRPPAIASVPEVPEQQFRELDARTNRQLLARLHRDLPAWERRGAKRHFYGVVHLGGQMLAALGALVLLLAATMRSGASDRDTIG